MPVYIKIKENRYSENKVGWMQNLPSPKSITYPEDWRKATDLEKDIYHMGICNISKILKI